MKPGFCLRHLSQLTERHTVKIGDRCNADKTFEVRIQNISFDAIARKGVRAIEYIKWNFISRRGFHREDHRRKIRVRSHADILNIEDERVYTSQHLTHRFASRAIERIDRNASEAFEGIACNTGLALTHNSMFWSKQ